MKEELKKCPFCGGDAKLEKPGDGIFFVFCQSCKVSTHPQKNYHLAKKSWNNRMEGRK